MVTFTSGLVHGTDGDYLSPVTPNFGIFLDRRPVRGEVARTVRVTRSRTREELRDMNVTRDRSSKCGRVSPGRTSVTKAIVRRF